jgi:NIMA-interacting peptidyl-prolyl cis-trans isomerase 1
MKLALSLAILFLSACASAGAGASGDTKPTADPQQACIASAHAKYAHKTNEPDTITVRHILVKHTGSKNYTQGLTRTEGEACLRAAEALGSVHRAELDPAFADAAFALDPGQMSNVVETPFGFHVIVRTE